MPPGEKYICLACRCSPNGYSPEDHLWQITHRGFVRCSKFDITDHPPTENGSAFNYSPPSRLLPL